MMCICLNCVQVPVLEEQINYPISTIFMVKENEESPIHQPYPVLELI
uniref:Eukaryotic translation initiation factor 3 subunit 6 n=1 Tax=Arundo donax TaxID=35708 RepID=A0A0A9DGQ5_ARUDO